MLYSLRSAVKPLEPQSDAISVICVSDTHNTQPLLPNGDLLLHAGDLTQKGSFAELQAQLDWLNAQPHTYKVIIGGNHDLLLDRDFVQRFPERVTEQPNNSFFDLNWGSVIYLQDTSIILHFPNGRALTVYGSPNTPQFGTWAFQYPPKCNVWSNTIPQNIDILLTHGPPKCHLDTNSYGAMVGSKHLLRELYHVRPRLVVFGHVHESYGRDLLAFDDLQASWEEIVMGEMGWLALCQMSLLLLRQKMRGSNPSRTTCLVNAAIVGGQNNEACREPVSVML
jgi:predicted phosphodiesterase